MEPIQDDRFWTRRRIIIAVIVIIMILALLSPTIFNILEAANNDSASFRAGPTPTALPSI
jgi:CHASE2 domain-containing sensor protein